MAHHHGLWVQAEVYGTVSSRCSVAERLRHHFTDSRTPGRHIRPPATYVCSMRVCRGGANSDVVVERKFRHCGVCDLDLETIAVYSFKVVVQSVNVGNMVFMLWRSV